MEKRINLAEMIARTKESAVQQPQTIGKPAAKPNPYANNMLALLSGASEGVIVKSCAEGSEKRFRICVDDEGNISATEVIA